MGFHSRAVAACVADACGGRRSHPTWNFTVPLRDRLSHRIGASTPWGAGRCPWEHGNGRL